ncbi:hypothetical protein N3K66_004816 [Trichothecium roseum]|uniref:Uncharacterized protein n=1 Tax=Trichothecium roseum TaxID=47278 RepID=A0ACC0V2C1_9HYPO|nr:hypothetical protein N3K66_004816 [Trichothecium roseum]
MAPSPFPPLSVVYGDPANDNLRDRPTFSFSTPSAGDWEPSRRDGGTDRASSTRYYSDSTARRSSVISGSSSISRRPASRYSPPTSPTESPHKPLLEEEAAGKARRRARAKARTYEDLLDGGEVRAPEPRRTDTKPVRECVPGHVISLPVHSASDRDRVAAADMYHTWSSFGIVQTKYRKCVVSEVWERHVIALPIFTYGGRGLEGKENAAREYLRIRTRDKMTAEERTSACEGKLIVAERDRDWSQGSCFIDAPAVLHLTNRLTLQEHERCSVEGEVVEDGMATIFSAIETLWLSKQPQIHAKRHSLSPVETIADVKAAADDIKEEEDIDE